MTLSAFSLQRKEVGRKTWIKASAALLAGCVTPLAFAPFGYWPVQIATLAFIFHLVLRAPSIRQSIFLGCAYGFGWLLLGIHWLYISMHQYGAMPAPIAASAVALLAASLSLFPGLALGGGLWLAQRWAANKSTVLLLILPAVWTLNEWLRGWIFTGFPWISSGYAHTASPLAGFAPIVGVYGIAWCSALIAACMLLTGKRGGALWLALFILLSGALLRNVQWTQPHGQPINVRLLQGNIAQHIKFDIDQLSATLALYDALIRQTPADLIVTPETALPLFSHQLPTAYMQRLIDFSQRSQSTLMIGLPIQDNPTRYTNSVLGIQPNATAFYRYDKHHLVPFGEFIPWGFRWFVNLMHIPLGDFTSGSTLQAPLAVKDQLILPNICYEDLFGEEIAAQIGNQTSTQLGAELDSAKHAQPTILLNLSNIAWFGDSIALPQHLQISQMRALETRRPMLRATNTGATAVIDHNGKVRARLPAFEQAVLSTTVQGYRGWTPYILFGNRAIVVLTLLMLGIAWRLCCKRR